MHMKSHDLRTLIQMYGDARATVAVKSTKRLRDRLARVDAEIESRITAFEEAYQNAWADQIIDRWLKNSDTFETDMRKFLGDRLPAH